MTKKRSDDGAKEETRPHGVMEPLRGQPQLVEE